MSGADLAPAQMPNPSLRYRFIRGLVRAWVSFFFRKLRCLNPRALPEDGAAILFVAHPASFLDALLLITAIDRTVHCLLDQHFLQGPWRKMFAWLLDMIPYQPAGDGLRRACERACEVLADDELLLVFAEEQVVKPGEPPHFSPTAAAIAMQAESQSSGQLNLQIFPVHLFLPMAQIYSSELLIYVAPPLIPAEYLSDGRNIAEMTRALAAATEDACRQNVFRLQPEDVRLFLSDLEEVLRADLQDDWGVRRNWKQTVEGFGLSQLMVDWIDQLNSLHTGQLVALRDLLDRYREARRQRSLAQLEVEQSGAWMRTPWRSLASYVESVLGLPVAVYGMINHLIPGLILYFTGLLKKNTEGSEAIRWAARGLVLAGLYVIQILLCGRWFGRSVAGYYALTLPMSGAYLWRYGWLLRHRTRLLLLHHRIRSEAARLVRMRKGLIRELNAARDVYLDLLGLTHQ